jgi:hypothetical protein
MSLNPIAVLGPALPLAGLLFLIWMVIRPQA